MGRYEKFTPVIQLDEITTAEENILAELAAIVFQTGDLIYYNGADLVRLAVGSTGQTLQISGGIPSWGTVGSGDVGGPSGASDNAITRFDGLTGKLIQNSGALVDDSGNITPSSASGADLGTSGLPWDQVYLGTGGSINFNAGDVTITHSLNLLTIAGGDLTISGALTVTGTTTLAVALTGVLRADAGIVSVDSDVTDLVSAASTILAGKVELATTAEINTGTDTTRAMPVDQYVASNRNMRYFNIRVLDPSTSHTVTPIIGGDFECPITGTITEVGAWEDTAGTTGVGTIDINKNGTTILSTKITIDSAEKTSRTAATPAVISVTTIAAGDIITVDLDGIQTTPAKGLVIRVGIRLT